MQENNLKEYDVTVKYSGEIHTEIISDRAVEAAKNIFGSFYDGGMETWPVLDSIEVSHDGEVLFTYDSSSRDTPKGGKQKKKEVILKYTGDQDLIQPREGDAGIDLRASEQVTLYQEKTEIINTGVCIELPPGYWAEVRPRSGLSSKGVIVTPGTIDNGYRGEIGVIIAHHGPKLHWVIEKGERIAQLVIHEMIPMKLEKVDELSETERGDKGFGSTGIK